jgi:hypothetical protein
VARRNHVLLFVGASPALRNARAVARLPRGTRLTDLAVG